MAIRRIDTRIARDSQWKEMPIRVRYFWFYLLTTDFSSCIGIFYLPLEQVALDTDLSIEEIKMYLYKLKELDLIDYSPRTSEIAIWNYPRFNIFGWTSNMARLVEDELSVIKDLQLIKSMHKRLSRHIKSRPNDKSNEYLGNALKLFRKAIREEEPLKGEDKVKEKEKEKENELKETNKENTDSFEDKEWQDFFKEEAPVKEEKENKDGLPF